MTTPKQPQDRKPKQQPAEPEEPDEYFDFEHDGRTYVMPNKTLDVVTPGFIRKHRQDEADLLFAALELLTEVPDEKDEDGNTVNRGRDVLDVIDNLPIKDWKAFQRRFHEHLGATLGE